MSTYRFAVKVARDRVISVPTAHRYRCPACGWDVSYATLDAAHLAASIHAARCKALHFANLRAACPCTADGAPNPACCACLGRGYERNPR